MIMRSTGVTLGVMLMLLWLPLCSTAGESTGKQPDRTQEMPKPTGSKTDTGSPSKGVEKSEEKVQERGLFKKEKKTSGGASAHSQEQIDKPTK